MYRCSLLVLPANDQHGFTARKTFTQKITFPCVACIITITVVVDVSLWVNHPSNPVSEDSVIDSQDTNQTNPVSEDSVIDLQDTYQTLCVYLKQFRLSENKKVSVCAIEDAVRVDRIFYNNQASIHGIWLDVSEWRTLLRLWGSIQSAMMKAENELD